VVAVTFCSPSDRIVKRLKFVVLEITLGQCFVEINHMAVVETMSGTL
jgi:hypothetical protein